MVRKSSSTLDEKRIRAGTPGRERRTLASMLVALLLAGGLLALYAGSLNDLLVADDLGLVNKLKDMHFSRVFAVDLEWHHYVPVQQLILYMLANMAGFEPVAYHAAALLFGWMSAALVFVLTRQLTGRFEIAALAGMLFVAFGTNWEPYLRAAAGIAYTAATVLTLAGLSLYIRANDRWLSRRGRRLAYSGFLVALILAPLAYELGIMLIGACALYRFFVLEHDASFAPGARARRIRGWLRDFLFPALLVLVWLSFKVLLGPTEQAPGLASSWESRVESLSIGLPRIFLPEAIPAIFDDVLMTINPLIILLVELVIIALAVWRGTPVVRFLVLWASLLLIVLVVGIGDSMDLSSRHLYMNTGVASILWAVLAWRLIEPTARALSRFGVQRHIVRMGRFIPTLAVAVILGLAGSHYALEQRAQWESATDHADEILSQIEQLSRDHPSATHLYLLDLPAATRTTFNEPLPILPAYSVPLQVELRMPGRFSQITPVVTHSQGKRLPARTVALSSVEQAIQQPEALALRYDETDVHSGRLKVWYAPPDPAELTRVTTPADAMVVWINEIHPTRRLQQDGPIIIPPTDLISVKGWAGYVSTDRRAGGVLVEVDNHRHFWADYPLARLQRRPQSMNGNPGLPWRFIANIPVDEIGAGRHTLSLKVVAPDYETYQETEEIEIEVKGATSGAMKADRDGARGQ